MQLASLPPIAHQLFQSSFLARKWLETEVAHKAEKKGGAIDNRASALPGGIGGGKGRGLASKEAACGPVEREIKESRSVSRVLSRTVIHLGRTSPHTS